MTDDLLKMIENAIAASKLLVDKSRTILRKPMQSNLSLSDAVKTGKPFKRAGWKHCIINANATYPIALSLADIAACDWETSEEKVVQFTEPEFERAWLKVFGSAEDLDKRNALAKELGLSHE